MCALRIVQHLTEIYDHDLKHDYDFDEQLRNIKGLQSAPPSPKPETPLIPPNLDCAVPPFS